MNFGNYSNPFMDIYKKMLSRVYEQYLYHSGKQDYHVLQQLNSEPLEAVSSIDSILAQDSDAVLDKVKNTALSIAYRINIHKDMNDQFDHNWYIIKNQIVGINEFYTYRIRDSERRKSMLTSDLIKVYKEKMDEKLQCWKDLKDEMRYFVHLFHQYKQFKGDRKLLE